jgi:ketosteroid isomerase-like protein
MSQDHVRTLRALVEAINRGDFDDALRYMHPEVEIYPAVGGELDIQPVYRGHEGFQRWWERSHDGFEMTVKVEEVLKPAEDRVLQVELWCPRGRQGIETETEISDLYAFRDGLVHRVEGFRDRAEALEAAGLRE